MKLTRASTCRWPPQMYGKPQDKSNGERRQRPVMLAKPEIIQNAKELIAEKKQECDERP